MLVELFGKVLFWSFFATIVACIEIESEGSHGWAEKMPTWYRTTGIWGRLYGILMNGKPLTGYHLFMFFVPILIFHVQFFMGLPWSIDRELIAWAMYFGWCPMWDYHWFVLNPAYRGRFKKQSIWWHAKSHWVGGLFPIDYLWGASLSFAFATGAALHTHCWGILRHHASLAIGWLLYTGLLHLVAPMYQRWYMSMREKDDRDRARAGIFD